MVNHLKNNSLSRSVGKGWGEGDSAAFMNLTCYSGLNLNQYGVALPCRTICTVCGFVALS